jgi:hypothetical protein
MLKKRIVKNIHTQKESVQLLVFNRFVGTLYCLDDRKYLFQLKIGKFVIFTL